MSERVTWETCPNCKRLAAVGWLDGSPIRLDCPNGCSIGPLQAGSTFRLCLTNGLSDRPGWDDRGKQPR